MVFRPMGVAIIRKHHLMAAKLMAATMRMETWFLGINLEPSEYPFKQWQKWSLDIKDFN